MALHIKSPLAVAIAAFGVLAGWSNKTAARDEARPMPPAAQPEPARENPGHPARLGARFGTASKIGQANPPPTHPVIRAQVASPSWGRHGWWWGGSGAWGCSGFGPRLGYWQRDQFAMPMQGAVATIESPPVDPNLGLGQAPTEIPAEPVDEGRAALSAGQWDLAARIFERRLTGEPDNLDWARQQALALAGAARTERAAGTLAAAMSRNPDFAANPIDVSALSPEQLRRVITVSSGHANTAGTPESWLLVAALMQAEGRPDQSRRMLERALGAGLDAEMGKRLLDAIGAGAGSVATQP